MGVHSKINFMYALLVIYSGVYIDRIVFMCSYQVCDSAETIEMRRQLSWEQASVLWAGNGTRCELALQVLVQQ